MKSKLDMLLLTEKDTTKSSAIVNKEEESIMGNETDDTYYDQLLKFSFPNILNETDDTYYDQLDTMLNISANSTAEKMMDNEIMFDAKLGVEVDACLPIDGLVARSYIVFMSLLQYFLPLIVLILTYSIIAYYVYVINASSQVESRSLRSTTSSGASSTNTYTSIGKNKKKVK